MRSGYLARDYEEKKKNGNGNGSNNGNGNGNGHSGNGNGGNGNGNGGGNGGGLSESFMSLPLNVEVPRSPVERNMGLMFRETLDDDSGMLFVFDHVGVQDFYMKNTTIPLDIAFINEEGIIESIKQLEPLNTKRISSDFNILYALEVNQGWFEENGVKVGDKVLNF